MAVRWTIVVEVGKTLTKATLWDEGGKLRVDMTHYRSLWRRGAEQLARLRL